MRVACGSDLRFAWNSIHLCSLDWVLDFILSQLNSRYTLKLYFVMPPKWHGTWFYPEPVKFTLHSQTLFCNASQVTSYHLRLGRIVWFLSSHFPTKIFKTLCMLITYSFDPPWFDDPNNTRQKFHITSLSVMQFPFSFFLGPIFRSLLNSGAQWAGWAVRVFTPLLKNIARWDVKTRCLV